MDFTLSDVTARAGPAQHSYKISRRIAAARRAEPRLAPLLPRMRTYTHIRRLAAHGVLTAAGEVLEYALYRPDAAKRLAMETVRIDRQKLERQAAEFDAYVAEVREVVRAALSVSASSAACQPR
ncbi:MULTISPECIES: hypothetical protein [unclassified Chelatococcus]|uniref:hypothetical protein n=1 Tax=unclassified Chelatococcus TaxID=2638111 RepID=UPI001BCAA343|nr:MULTISPECIES: hypothetical protein [unclassified Chelatococcus]MBS7696226.1 hypothetical protein [Chelatococcus sp. YT9]MBX3557747.1 hypothetical protein [Chelatococcus sp.]